MSKMLGQDVGELNSRKAERKVYAPLFLRPLQSSRRHPSVRLAENSEAVQTRTSCQLSPRLGALLVQRNSEAVRRGIFCAGDWRGQYGGVLKAVGAISPSISRHARHPSLHGKDGGFRKNCKTRVLVPSR